MQNKGGKAGGSNVIYPRTKNSQKTQQQTRQKQKNPTTKTQTKGGVRIGEYKLDDKWRCKICKYLNDIDCDICKTCDEPRFPNEKK